MKLRSQGFKPSNANRLAIEEALDSRPNQAPLIEALKATLAYQRKQQAQSQLQAQSGGRRAGDGRRPDPRPDARSTLLAPARSPAPTLGIPIG